MPFDASCRAVVAVLQRQDGVLTNSRLPCSTAEKARGSVHAIATAGLRCLEVPRLTSQTTQTRQAKIRGAGRRIVAGTHGTYSTADWWPGSFPVGLEGLSTDLCSPCFRTLGDHDEGSWRLFIPSSDSAWPRFFILRNSRVTVPRNAKTARVWSDPLSTVK